MRSYLVLFFFCIESMLYGQAFKELDEVKYNNVLGVVIGISDYQARSLQLSYADEDARLMHQVLTSTFPKASYLDTLINAEATQMNIHNSLKKIVEDAAEGDLVVFYFSGHGDVVEDVIDGEEGYFLAHDASDSRNYNLTGGAVEFQTIRNFITKVTDKNASLWMITDACRSGGAESIVDGSKTLSTLSAQFNNTTKFISCGKNQLSFEDDGFGHGVFTYYLVKALSGEADSEEGKGKLNSYEIDAYLKTNVRAHTEKQQTPSVQSADVYEDIVEANNAFLDLLASSAASSLSNSKGSYKTNDEVIAFEDQLVLGNLYGNDSSALAILNNLRPTSSLRKKLTSKKKRQQLNAMEIDLVNTLLNRGQRITNLFLSGRPMIGQQEQFDVATKDYALANELLHHEHELSKEIEGRRRFCEAMHNVQKGINLIDAEWELKDLKKDFESAALIDLGLSILYQKKGDFQLMDAYGKEAMVKLPTWNKPNNIMAYASIDMGNLQYFQQYYAEGEDAYTKLISQYLNLSNNELNGLEEAIEQTVIEDDNLNDEDRDKLIGALYFQRGVYNKALAYYSRAGFEEDKDILWDVVKIGEARKDPKLILFALRYILQIDSTNLAALNYRNLVLEEAIDFSFEEFEAQEVRTQSELIRLLMKTKNYSFAEQLIDTLLNHHIQLPQLYQHKARIMYLKNDLQATFRYADSSLALNPFDYDMLSFYTDVLAKIDRNDDIDSLLKVYKGREDLSAKYNIVLSGVHFNRNQDLKGYQSLQKAQEVDNSDTDVYRELYAYHIRKREYEIAADYFGQLMDIEPNRADSLDYTYLMDLALGNTGGGESGPGYGPINRKVSVPYSKEQITQHWDIVIEQQIRIDNIDYVVYLCKAKGEPLKMNETNELSILTSHGEIGDVLKVDFIGSASVKEIYSLGDGKIEYIPRGKKGKHLIRVDIFNSKTNEHMLTTNHEIVIDK